MLKLKKVLASVLAIIVCMMGNIQIFAMQAAPPISTGSLYTPTLSELVQSLQKDELVTSVHLAGNTLTYSLRDGTSASMQVSHVGNIVRYTVIENDIVDQVVMNKATSSIYHNGTPIKISAAQNGFSLSSTESAAAFDQYNLQSGNGWTFTGRTYPNVHAEQRIATMSSGALYAILLGAFGGVGVSISLAVTLIDCLAAMNSPATSLYATRDMYYYGDYIQFKTIDTYYIYPNYTGYITSRTTTHLGGA